MTDIDDSLVLVRRMDVTARVTDSVKDLSPYSQDGILLETLIGRYVLDRDGREAWLMIDGVQSIADIAAGVARKRQTPVDQIFPAVIDFCGELLDRGLVDIAAPTQEMREPDRAIPS